MSDGQASKKAMTYLEKRLQAAEKKFGKDDKYVQMIRDQLAAQKDRPTGQEIFIAGMRSRTDGNKPQTG